jgi:hypothetical protein
MLIEMLDLARLMRVMLLEDYDIRDLISFLNIFLGDEQYELLALNTNKYIVAYLEVYPNKRVRF